MCVFDWEREDTIDPSTGILLIPGFHGDGCPGSGEIPGYECCCDECDYFLICFRELDFPGEKVLAYANRI